MADVAQDAYCIVERAGVRLAVPVADVCRVLGRRQVTPIPRTPAFIFGLVSDGGQPVLALRLDPWLSMSSALVGLPSALVVLRGTDPPFGVAVDRLCGVALLPQVVEAGAAAGGVAASIVAAYRRGADGVVPILAVGGLIDAVTGSPAYGREPGGGADGG